MIADDDPDDRMLIEDAFAECRLNNERHYVENGEEVFQYLRAEGKWSHRDPSDLPGLIILDLNMPRMDGRAVLLNLASDPLLKRVPVVILTTSKEEEDILRAHNLGANSFISKPETFGGLLRVVRSIRNYWIELVELPSQFQN